MKNTCIVAFLLLTLTGCETMTQVRSASSQGMAGLSCPQIYSTFEAYKRDKQNVEALRTLGELQGLDVSQATTENAAGYYDTVVATANIALAVQGCSPLPL